MLGEISQDSVLAVQEQMRQGIVECIDQVYSEVKIWSRTITEVGFINSNLLSYKNWKQN